MRHGALVIGMPNTFFANYIIANYIINDKIMIYQHYNNLDSNFHRSKYMQALCVNQNVSITTPQHAPDYRHSRLQFDIYSISFVMRPDHQGPLSGVLASPLPPVSSPGRLGPMK